MTPKRPPPPDAYDRAVVLDARVRQRQIGLELRRLFGAVAEEPISSVFLDLLDQLDAREEEKALKSRPKEP